MEKPKDKEAEKKKKEKEKEKKAKKEKKEAAKRGNVEDDGWAQVGTPIKSRGKGKSQTGSGSNSPLPLSRQGSKENLAKKPVASRGGFAALMMDSDEGDDDDDDDSDEKSASEEESEEEVEPSRSSSRCPDVHVLSRLWRHMGQVSNVAWRFARTRLLTSGFRCAGGGRGRG